MKDFELLAKQWESSILSADDMLLILGGEDVSLIVNNCKCSGNNCNCHGGANNCDCNKPATTGNNCGCGTVLKDDFGDSAP